MKVGNHVRNCLIVEGGERDQAAVTALLKATEHTHFVEAKPSFVKELSKADMFVQVARRPIGTLLKRRSMVSRQITYHDLQTTEQDPRSCST